MPTEEKLEEVLEKIRPALRQHGGDIQLVGINEDTGQVRVKLLGACQGCPFATITMSASVQTIIKEAFPQVNQVIAVTRV